MQLRYVLTASLLLALAAGSAMATPASCYAWVLRDRLRGGYLAANDPRGTVTQMQAIGMNAVLPKFGGLTCPPDETNLRLLREWGEAAHQAGLHFLPVINLRGGDTERILSSRREVTATGKRMERTPCPLDAGFWQAYVLNRAVDLAKRGKALPITGVILDPEMYGADHTVFQDACFCDDCLREFLQATATTAPEPLPPPQTRAAWLTEQHLAERYQQHFVERVTALARLVEQAVHEANREFLIGVFLLDYPTPFMRGLAQGLGTSSHPVLGFSETTYPAGYTEYVEAQQKAFAAMPAQVLFLPGLWIAKFPTENLAEQCYACAQHAAGYWIYTFESLVEDVSQLPGYTLSEPNQLYWDAMQRANAEIDRFVAAGSAYESTLKVRPFDTPLKTLVPGELGAEVYVPVPSANPITLGAEAQPRLRYRNPLMLLAKAGEAVAVSIGNAQLNANYRSRTQYAVFDAVGTRVQDGTVKLGESTTVRWIAQRDGLFVVIADSDQNGYTLNLLTPQPFGLKATRQQPLTVNGALGRLYFYVPDGVAVFSLTAKAEGQAAGRGGKLAIHAPDGQIVGRLEGDLGTAEELVITVAPEQQERVWTLSAEDITNDLTVSFSANLNACLGPNPSRLLTTKGQ